MINIPKAANSNSTINDSTKSSHVTYTERYQSGSNSNGNPTYSNTTWNSDAKVTGELNSSSSNVFINGSPAIKVGDSTQEQWTADPEPYPHYGDILFQLVLQVQVVVQVRLQWEVVTFL